MNNLTVIIPNRYPDIIRPMLESFARFDVRERVIIVANGHNNSYGFEKIDYDWKKFDFSHAVNLGIQACQGNVILFNDDCVLLENDTFQRLDLMAKKIVRMGILSPLIKGCAGNPIQRWHERERWWRDFEELKVQPGKAPICFPCVWISRAMIAAIGPLKENLPIHYGGDDVEYCIRARNNKFLTCVTSAVTVQHGDGSNLLGDGRGVSWSASYARVYPH